MDNTGARVVNPMVNLDHAHEMQAILMQLGRVQRLTEDRDGNTESVAAHSVALAFFVHEAAGREKAHACATGKVLMLDAFKLLVFALVHDLPEADTGDMPTLVPLTDEQRKEKAEKEAVAIERFRRETFPWLARWIDLYELRECAESRFVSACDKMIPMLTYERNGCAVAKRFYDYPAFEETMWKRQELAELLYPEFPALMATRRVLTQRALDAWNRSDDKEHPAESLSWVSTQQAVIEPGTPPAKAIDERVAELESEVAALRKQVDGILWARANPMNLY